MLMFIQCETPNIPTKKSNIKGKDLYLQFCQSCHGKDGKKGMLDAKDLSTSTLNQDEVVYIISNGRNNMMPYKSILNNEQIIIIADYIKTLKKQ
jgi:mono/diheme cytochrome c family protein